MGKSGKRGSGPSIANQASDMRMNMALRQIGFGPASRPRAVPAPAPPPRPDAADTLALKRREWLLDVMERQRALSPYASGLLTTDSLSGEDFLHGFYAAGRPVLIKGAMAGWPALEKWTPDYLLSVVGNAPVDYQGGRNGAADFEQAKDRHRRNAPFRDVIALILEGGNDAYITAYNNAANSAAFAPLMADLGFLDAYLTQSHGMLWIGSDGAFTPLHFDLTNNLLAQVTGTKRVILIPPSQTRRLAHRTHVFSDVRDITDPQRLAAHPQARDVIRYEVLLTPGDLLFIPIGWWHQVRSESFSTMLTYTNFRWPNIGHENYPAG